MSPGPGMVGSRSPGFPRVSGDEPGLISMAKPGEEFSPREWG